MTQDELLHLAQARGLTREQVITMLSAFLASNERYLARRRGRKSHSDTETDELLDTAQPALAWAIQFLEEAQG